VLVDGGSGRTFYRRNGFKKVSRAPVKVGTSWDNDDELVEFNALYT